MTLFMFSWAFDEGFSYCDSYVIEIVASSVSEARKFLEEQKILPGEGYGNNFNLDTPVYPKIPHELDLKNNTWVWSNNDNIKRHRNSKCLL